MSARNTEVHEQFFLALVDDEPRIHDFLTAELSSAGILERHVSFYDPVSFMEFLQLGEEEPDAVLLDIHFENSGLSGIDILPFIREEYPYLPVILLTGMDSDAVREAQNYQCTYFIPKPVSAEQLIKMIQFYVGKSRQSAESMRKLIDEMQDFRDYQQLLEEEIEKLEAEDAQPEATAPAKTRQKKEKGFKRIQELVSGLLQNSEILPSFVKDLEQIFNSQFGLFKKVTEVLIRFDVMDLSNPGMNIHKHKGTDNVYSARLSKKARLFFYISPVTGKKKMLRLDTVHDTKGMDKWLKENHPTYADE